MHTSTHRSNHSDPTIPIEVIKPFYRTFCADARTPLASAPHPYTEAREMLIHHVSSAPKSSRFFISSCFLHPSRHTVLHASDQ